MSEKLAIHGGPPVRTESFASWPVYHDDEAEALLRVLGSGKWGRLHGEEVSRFERRFAAFQQAAHAVAVPSGTVALRIALLAAGIQAGDEVIVPPYTFLATATAVVEVNATPVFADVELETFNLDPRAVEAAVTDRTRVVIPVHLGGLPADMDAIRQIAARHDLIVIEDAAHAHGAQYKDRRVGALGQMGCFSFQSSKNLTAGEGGAVLTDDDELAARCRSIHNCGRAEGGAWYEHHTIAGNYRMTEFQGAVLNCQLDRLEEQAVRREANGKLLAERLGRLDGIVPQLRTDACTRHGYHLFAFRLDPQALGASREAFLEAVRAEGVPVSAGYVVPLYRQPLFAKLAFGPYTGFRSARPQLDYASVHCPNCETLCTQQGAWLTQNILLGSRQDIDDVARAFEKVHAGRHSLVPQPT